MVRHVIYIILIAATGFMNCNRSHSNPTSLADIEKMEATILSNISIVQQYQAALESLLAEKPSSEETAAIYFKLGKLNEVYGHYEKAVEFYQTLVCHYPQSPETSQALFNMAEIYWAIPVISIWMATATSSMPIRRSIAPARPTRSTVRER